MSDIEMYEAHLAALSDALRHKELEGVVDDELLSLMRKKAFTMLALADAIEASES